MTIAWVTTDISYFQQIAFYSIDSKSMIAVVNSNAFFSFDVRVFTTDNNGTAIQVFNY